MKGLNTFYFALIMLLMVLVSFESVWAQEATFNFTGAQQSFVVPNGVYSVHIQAWGAQGATDPTDEGGFGGFVEGDLVVTPGQTLEIFVGGRGLNVANETGGGGFNGGGNARSTSASIRGGGGGASDVRVNGASFNDRVIVAAGGGGGPCDIAMPIGGNGGGLEGGVSPSLEPGGGGTQNSGGAGFAPAACLDGEFGIGGSSAPNSLCGGGGGGWYGGGSGCGGGGGSSYIEGVGLTNGTTTSGQRRGDGLVILTWTVANINLSPNTATNNVRTEHTVTAIVVTDNIPEPGVLVIFEITSGPNAGEMSDPGSGECSTNDDCTADGNGQVSWTYSSLTLGTDTIVASIEDTDIKSNTVEKIWVTTRNVPTLSEWGLIAMASILGIVGFMVIRKRKVTA